MNDTTSPAQLAANQANAQHSSGPKTAAGKARSSQNARKPFKGEDFTAFRMDDPQAINEIYLDFRETLLPINPMEDLFIRRMAMALHSINRLYKVESGLMSGSMDRMLDGHGLLIKSDQQVQGNLELTRTLNRNYAAAEGLDRLCRKNQTYPHFLRHQAQAERIFRHAFDDFLRLKSMRDELDQDRENQKVLIEANFDPQPEETATTSADPKPTQFDPDSVPRRTGAGEIAGIVNDNLGPLADTTVATMDSEGDLRLSLTGPDGKFAFQNLGDDWFRLFIVNPEDIESIRYNRNIDHYEKEAQKILLAIGEKVTHDLLHR